MRYPKDLKIIVDITKPPYCADNTGKTDCTEALQKAFDDIIMRSVELFDETFEKLSGSPKGENTYLGFQSRSCPTELNVSFSEHRCKLTNCLNFYITLYSLYVTLHNSMGWGFSSERVAKSRLTKGFSHVKLIMTYLK